MQLHIKEVQPGNPTVKVGWSLNAKEKKDLLSHNYPNVHVLLVVVNAECVVDVKLIPIGEPMIYLSFTRPGENTVFATVVWAEKYKHLMASYMQDSDWLYDSKSKSLCFGRTWGHFEETNKVFSVAPEFFAKEPSEFEKWWVNLWYETKPKDQCQLRGRRWVAYTIQPIAVLAWVILTTLFRLVSALFLAVILTRRNVNFVPIIHPFRDDARDVWNDVRGSDNSWTHKKDGEGRYVFVWLYHPGIILTITTAVWGILGLQNKNILWLKILAMTLLFSTLLLVLALVVEVIVVAVVSIWHAIVKTTPTQEETLAKMKEARLAAEKKKELAKFKADVLLLGYDANRSLDLNALPADKRTFKLYFFDLKARVCKTYAR